MRKISLEQANELLKEWVGDVVAVADSKEADKDIDIEAIATEAKEAIQSNATVDPAIVSAEVSKETGKLLGTLRSQLAKVMGGTQRDYIGSDDKPLTIQEMVNLAKSKFDERTGTQAQQWEQERQQLIEEHEAALEKTKAEYEAIVATEKNKYVERDISAATLSMLEKIPRKGGDLADDADTLLYKARQQYDIKYDEAKKELQFFEKGGNKPASVKPADFAKQWIEKSGRLATDTRHIAPKDIKNNPQPPQGGILPKEPTEKQIPTSQEDIYSWANQ